MKIKYACRGIPKTKVRGDVCSISCQRLWALSIKSCVRVRNQMKGTICLVCPEYSGPSLKVVHFIRFNWSDRNVPFRRLTKFCPQYRSPVSCLQVQYWRTLVNLWLFSSLRASSPFGDIVKSRRAIGTRVIARSRAACFARPIG